MFKIEGFVEDKNLPKVLHALDGLVMDLRTPPVRNAVKQNGKLKSTAANSTAEAIVAYAHQAKINQISAKQIKEALSQSGFSPTGYSTAIVNAVKAKVLKKTKERGQYVVIAAKESGVDHG